MKPSHASIVADEVLSDAERVIEGARLTMGGTVVGTVAARDEGLAAANYGECFVRDFAVTAAAWLPRGQSEPVACFIRTLADVQSRTTKVQGGLRPAEGLMPASFSIQRDEADRASIVADFGQRAIGRVVPVDSALWWLMILRAYQHATGDTELARSEGVRDAIERILALYLKPQFEMLPSLLVPDGSAMIDRRMGVHGHPIDVQVLYWAALRSARKLIGSDHPLQEELFERLVALGHHLRKDYWLDRARIEQIRRFPVEEYGPTPRNPWNLHPDAIPAWTMSWLHDDDVGYFAGNLGPSRLDVHLFMLGNLLAVSTGLASPQQATAFFDMIELHERDLLGASGVKLMYPPLEGRDWHTLTGSDHKNVAWSYHNAGTWPMLLWPLASAARAAGRTGLAERILAQAAPRICRDGWPEYYDGPYGGLVGRQSRLQQTWSAAAVAAASQLLREPDRDDPFAFDHDQELEDAISAAEDIPASGEQRG